jgi:PIN domain nuclease of toxin-antitoxin system
VRVLLDTHVFLWAITDDSRLSARHQQIYASQDNELYLSMASLWEMLIKAGLGKLPVPTPAAEFITKQMDKNRVGLLPIRVAHLAKLETLPPLHRDPFDRMIAAQALAEDVPVMTVDGVFSKYRVGLV